MVLHLSTDEMDRGPCSSSLLAKDLVCMDIIPAASLTGSAMGAEQHPPRGPRYEADLLLQQLPPKKRGILAPNTTRPASSSPAPHPTRESRPESARQVIH